MQNLEQIRAAEALEPAKKLKRSAIAGLPALIVNNGLLAAAAFANADGGGDNRKHLEKAMTATATYLAKRQLISPNITSIEGLIADLSQRDSLVLQRATGEALAYLAYLKRFAPKEEN